MLEHASTADQFRAVYGMDHAVANPTGARYRRRPARATRGARTRPTSRSRRSSTPDLTESGLREFKGARALAILGNSITTDHISPIGNIKASSPAGLYLQGLGVKPVDFNNYGSRRMNHEVMVRGTFANVRLRNLMVPGVEGGVTIHQPGGEQTSIYEAAMRYAKEKVPLFVIAGEEYGTGSARDWAAKGTRLLGVRAIVAGSFERIHRSNLVGMGVLPCQLPAGVTAATLELERRRGVRSHSASTRTRSRARRSRWSSAARTARRRRCRSSCASTRPAEIDYVRQRRDHAVHTRRTCRLRIVGEHAFDE